MDPSISRNPFDLHLTLPAASDVAEKSLMAYNTWLARPAVPSEAHSSYRREEPWNIWGSSGRRVRFRRFEELVQLPRPFYRFLGLTYIGT